MKSITKNTFTYSPLLVWLIFCLILFVYISRISFVSIVAPGWKLFVEMLAHISPLRYALDLISAGLGVLLFSLACLSLGLGILGKRAQSHSSKLALGVTCLIVGQILFSVIFLAVISLYRLTPSFVVTIVMLGFLIGLPALRSFIAHLPSPASLPADFKLSEKIILALAVTGLFFGLLLSSTRLGYDATAAYFSHAKIMAVSQLPIFFHPKDSFVVTAFHPVILFTALIHLFGDQSARMLPWINGMAIILMGLALGQELGLNSRARLWFLVLMVTSTAFTDLLGDGKIELISTAPILASIYWMVHGMEKPASGTFALTGLLSGFAIISRPYNIFLVSLFIALFIISRAFAQYRGDGSGFKRFMKSLLWIMPPLFALGIFHLLQNWIWLGNPIAPLIYAGQIKSGDWAWQFDPANLTLYRLFYPLTLTYMNSAQSLGNISPLLVGFFPFLLLKKVRENIHITPLLGWLSAIAVLTLLLWITLTFTVVEIRYVLFLWVILFLVTAQMLESVTQHMEISFRPLLITSVTIFLAVMIARTFIIAVSSYFPANDTRHCPDNNLCAFMDTLSQHASGGDRVFVLHAYRYYLRPDLFACSSRVDEYPALEALARQNSPDFWAEVYRQGFRFIIFEEHLSEMRYNFGKLPSPDIAPDWIHIKVLYSSASGNQLIYKIEAVEPPVTPEIFCQQDSAGRWQLMHPFSSQP